MISKRMFPVPPESVLNKEGLKFLKKYGQERELRNHHFNSYEDYFQYRENVVTEPFKIALLHNVEISPDPVFLHNLSKILQEMSEDLDNKQNREYDD